MILRVNIILFFSILLLGCEDTHNYIIVQNEQTFECSYIINNKMDYIDLDFDGSFESANNCFFINNKVVCISTDYKVLYYNLKEKRFIRKIEFKKGEEYNSYFIIAVRINDSGDIIIISYGTIYKYNYKNDKLTEIYRGFDDLFNFNLENIRLFWNGSIIYCKERNSILFTIANFDTSDPNNFKRADYIKEFSLNDFSLKSIMHGSNPHISKDKTMYYISADQHEIREFDLNTFKDKRTILKYNLPIVTFIPNKNNDKIIFLNDKEVYGIKSGSNYIVQDSKIWDEKKNKITYFSDNYYATVGDIIFPEDMKRSDEE